MLQYVILSAAPSNTHRTRCYRVGGTAIPSLLGEDDMSLMARITALPTLSVSSGVHFVMAGEQSEQVTCLHCSLCSDGT